MRTRIGIRTRAALAASVALVAAGMATPSSANTNLAPNPSFEQSYLPQQVRNPHPLVDQPVLPVGWAFEGATELFDHAATHPPYAQNPDGGKYFVQISGSWSGPRARECSLKSAASSVPCVDYPGGPQRDQVYTYYSVAPAWRTQLPIPVTAGTQYTFSTWISNAFPLDGTGAQAKVRWVNAQGIPISTSNGPGLLAPAPNSGANYFTFIQQSAGDPNAYKLHNTPWTKRVVNNLTAPAGATGAILLLGYTDSAWFGSVSYDLVCFSVYQASGDVCA